MRVGMFNVYLRKYPHPRALASKYQWWNIVRCPLPLTSELMQHMSRAPVPSADKVTVTSLKHGLATLHCTVKQFYLGVHKDKTSTVFELQKMG